MSEHISPEVIQAALSRDERLRKVWYSDSIKAELANSAALRAVLAIFQIDSQAAVTELADISPTDHAAVAKLLVRIRADVYIRRTLEQIQVDGQLALADIHQQDMSGEDIE